MPEYDLLADLYNLEYAHDYDVPFWLSLAAREGSPVVEWGAGTGRISVPLAKRGSEVTAVELSEAMIERGRTKNESVTWIAGDMCKVKLDRTYKLAVCAFNSFLCLLDLEDALDFLRNARDHLMPDGLLGIEVSVFSPEELAEPSVSQLRHDFTRQLSEGKLDRFSASRYDPASQLMDMRLFYELYDETGELKNRRAHELRIRLTGRDELELMLRMSGFSVESVYGGFDGEPFDSGSEHLIVLARRTIDEGSEPSYRFCNSSWEMSSKWVAMCRTCPKGSVIPPQWLPSSDFLFIIAASPGRASHSRRSFQTGRFSASSFRGVPSSISNFRTLGIPARKRRPWPSKNGRVG